MPEALANTLPPALVAAMTGGEQALLRAAATGAQSMVEFGCGGSTAILLAAGHRLLSVDSDATWLARVAVEQGEAIEAGRLLQHHADIGPLGDWGWPLHPPSPLQGQDYWHAPWALMPSADLVLVDGRFRVACALAAHGRLTPCGVLAIHDYWNRRAYQQGLDDFFDTIGAAGTMALLKPRLVEAAALAQALERHAADPR